ncbi:MAG: hypothetical protein U1E70_08240 [Acetobacteraceae bacterium]
MSPPRLGLVVIDNKPFGSDFRKYLLRAAAAAGGPAVHVFCRPDKVLVTCGERTINASQPPDDPAAVGATVLSLLGDAACVVLVGLGTSPRFSSLVRALRQSPNVARVLYDVFDYFRFGSTGRDFLRSLAVDLFWRRHTQKALLLDAGLRWLYPGSWALANASHLGPVEGVAQASPRRLVYLGSIDRRVDFDWLRRLATLDVSLDIYGRVHETAPQVTADLQRLLAGSPAIRFLGAYDNDDLPRLLCGYRIGILPYKRRDTLTRHVNPDKLYHYLNAGLEVVAADIPQAVRLAAYLHLVRSPDDLSAAVVAAQTEPKAAGWIAAEHSWDRRWAELAALVRGR